MSGMLRRSVAGMACLLLVVPGLVHALELGPIEVRSAQHEPLNAQIPMKRVQAGDIEGLKVTLGSPAQFELAGVARLQHLDLLRFGVVGQGEGGGYIHVWTEEPIVEPSLTFLIEVDWPRGRAVRGYRLRLPTGPRTPIVERANVAAGAQAHREPEVGSSTSAPASTTANADAYGPVPPSETLWSIAARLRPDGSVSVQRMMLAILQTNPDAFAIDNVNALLAGATLRIPTREEIGPDDAAAAIAEVKRQHAAWKEHRVPVRPALALAPAPRDSGPQPEERPEERPGAVSPDTAVDVADRAQELEIQALRDQLARAVEEADARRRRNDEFALRLAEAETRIKELSRLIERKDEEIAMLQAELRTLAEAPPPPSRMETMPTPVPSDEVSIPTPAPSDEASIPTPAQTTPDDAGTASMPFGLGALPVNPVFLVGGAGLLLILLGVVALLHRRRASAGDDDESDSTTEFDLSPRSAEGAGADERPSADGNSLLHQLEAVAAELADEDDDSPRRDARSAPSVVSRSDTEHGAARPGTPRFDPDDLSEAPMTELRPGTRPGTPGTERARPEATDSDDDTAELTFDIDALAGAEAESDRPRDRRSDIFDDSDHAAPTAKPDADAMPPVAGAVDDVDGDPDPRTGVRDPRDTDSDAPFLVPRAGAGEPTGHDRIRDESPQPPTVADRGDPPESDIGAPGTAAPRTGRTSASADRPQDGPRPESGGSGGAGHPAPVRFEAGPDDRDPERFSLDDLGENEVQTKIDLAQVYMEMGDVDSARGFLEAVLAEGDADEREVAREMLSRLS